jgi:hypothetical protein
VGAMLTGFICVGIYDLWDSYLRIFGTEDR